ncbi:hypothetical protein DL766_010378 [Monosporascus sp. MC13-8B]|uniref:SigF-like NTF2-like domain-containing protein n=1 Tax=Monosporascus cannonballus TaxID=155416 RepID=A0ABY0GSF3_9PEZI|nr:hypothetical protein DL762_009770 [Monosporascus cannonballus]RYO99883.1 hypothetical protein DL763_001166 [Monosporascus cannonballus]RYP02402.1 hypothetical protein DL766_010378 [Monosporascus sp. MC13-8B]
MDQPVREIPGIITALTQGNSEEQAKTLEDYFLPDAYFVHPLCRVPSFGDRAIPFPFSLLTSRTRTRNSRWLLLMIYNWYRILSPKILFTIDSVVFDRRASLLYLTMRQTFTLWFVPFDLWQAKDVKLVTVLELALLPVGEDGRPLPLSRDAAAAAAADDDDDYRRRQDRSRFFVRGQEDHYHVEEWLKFIAPWGGGLLWMAGQLFATLVCAVGVALWPFTLVRAVKRKQAQVQMRTKDA